MTPDCLAAAGTQKSPPNGAGFFVGRCWHSVAFDQYRSSTAPLLALEALNANLACTPRV
jgi:hypothetical protein